MHKIKLYYLDLRFSFPLGIEKLELREVIHNCEEK